MATTVDLGNVIGPQGPQGVQGIQGPKGETGPAGANWYILELEYNVSTSKLEPISDNAISYAINAIPYVICTVKYSRLSTTFVPTAFYKLYDKSVSNYCQYIQFSCLTLKDTAKDANIMIADYYNCIVVGENGTITGAVRDVDLAVNWSNVKNKPFSSIDTSDGVFNVDETGKISIKGGKLLDNCVDYITEGFITTEYVPKTDSFYFHFAHASTNKPGIVKVGDGLNVTNDGLISCAVNSIAPLTVDKAATAKDSQSLALGYSAQAQTSTDIAIGTQASTTTTPGGSGAANSTTGLNIAIGQEAKCSNDAHYSVSIGCKSVTTAPETVSIGHSATAKSNYAVAIGMKANCEYENSVALGANSEVDGERQVSVGSLDVRRRISYVDTPSDPLDAVNMSFVTKNTPKIIKLCTDVQASKAALDTNKTFAGFSNIPITSSTYYLVSTYIKDWTFIPEAIIFETIGSSIRPTKRQVFTVSQCQHVYVNSVLNLDILADCFVNFGMITNASSTMLNLARVELSMSSKTEMMMNVSSASAMGIDKNSTYGIYLYLKPGK